MFSSAFCRKIVLSRDKNHKTPMHTHTKAKEKSTSLPVMSPISLKSLVIVKMTVNITVNGSSKEIMRGKAVS